MLHPAGPDLTVWAFHDDLPGLAIWFDGDGDSILQFDDMAAAVYAALDTRRHKLGRRRPRHDPGTAGQGR